MKAIIYGILEGITEWLPVSSTGHLILLKEFFPLNVSSNFWSLFEVVIQLGAVMAAIMLYFDKIWPFKKNYKEVLCLWSKIIISCLPACFIGLLFDDFFEKYFYNKISISISLIVVGILFIIVEKYYKNDGLNKITFKNAFLIGLSQVIAAIFPGTSRSGITILCSLLLGISREDATEFTFLMSIPVMFGASFLKLFKFGFVFLESEVIILMLGVISSFVTSLFIIRFLLNYVKKNNFIIFGYYRIILGIIVLLGGL